MAAQEGMLEVVVVLMVQWLSFMVAGGMCRGLREFVVVVRERGGDLRGHGLWGGCSVGVSCRDTKAGPAI